ncbi:MAG: HD domain-containing protein [Pseudomonadota bacterium]
MHRNHGKPIPAVEAILEPWGPALGPDRRAYRNHVYRVIHFCAVLSPLSGVDFQQVLVAACFHDIGIWLDKTFDYLAPSRERARRFLADLGRPGWTPAVEAMIAWHHKLTPVEPSLAPLAEVFRRADWIDVSLGSLRMGLPPARISAIRRAFPNAGFHHRLAVLSLRRLAEAPLDPLPMMRW